MKRLIESYFEAWKKDKNRKPLIVRGARQVGKTYSIEKFGRESFEYFLKVDAEQDENLKEVFKSKNPERIINELSAYYGIPVIENKTLLFIDEIQAAPEAIVSLRYFREQMPKLHVIAAGSLLDYTLNELPYAMPVGRVEFAYMYPLNFKEFLLANDKSGLVDYLSGFSFGKPYSTALHQRIIEYLRLYFFIGGMPEAVRIYVESKNFIEVEKVHSGILTSFQYDFAKYGSRKQREYLKDCLLFAAKNVGRKVKYTAINKNVHSSYLKNAFIKLEMNRIIHLVRKTKSSMVPINQYVDENVFKPLFLDIGLMCNLSRIKLTDIKDPFLDFEGALAEQFAGQELIASFAFYDDAKLYYWTRDEKNANAEIDYLLQVENKIYPVEVKAGKTGTLKSLQVYLAEKKMKTGIRLNTDLPDLAKGLKAVVNVKGKRRELTYDLVSVPVYLAADLPSIIKQTQNLSK